MGLLSGAKKFFGGITGATAAKTARKAGRQQAAAIEAGARRQAREVPLALKDVVRGAGQAGREIQPFQQAGIRGIRGQEALLAEMGAYQPIEYRAAQYRPPTQAEVAASPAVQFRMQEAERALTARQAARGGALGGGAEREMARYMQGLASQEYESEASRRFREAQFAEEQAQYGSQFEEQQRRANLAMRMQSLQGLTGIGAGAAGQKAGIRERLGEMMSRIRTGSGAAAASAIQSAGQARASGAMAGAAAKQQAIGGLMKLGGQLAAAQMTGGASLALPGGAPGK